MTTSTTTNNAAAKILQRCVCLTLRRHWLGNNRKVDVDDLVEKSGGTFTLDDRMFSATKLLIDSKELKPVRSVQNRARAYLSSIALPAPRVFGDGSYLVPLPLVEQVLDQLKELRKELKREATKLSLRYSEAVEKQREALGPLFKISDYCQPEAVVDAYDIEWNFVGFDMPDKLTEVSAAIAEAEQKKQQARLASAFDDVIAGLRGTALDIVSDLAERLAPGEDGRPRVLRSTALDDLLNFANLLPQRNLGDDTKLAAAIKKLASHAKGIKVDDLRSSADVRNGLRAAAEQAKQTLAGLVQAGARRGIKLPGQGTAA